MSKTSDNQTAILSAIKRLGSSLRAEIRMGDRLLRKEMLKIEARVEDIEERQGEMNKKLDNLDSKLDGFVGTVNNLQTENVVGANQIRELREKTSDHDRRISKLEKTVQQA